MKKLKQKLLATGYFIDNQFLDDYLELVSKNAFVYKVLEYGFDQDEDLAKIDKELIIL